MKCKIEKVRFEVTLVPHGFEADIFTNDDKEEYGHIVRDFASDHDPSVSAAVLIQEFCRFMGDYKTAFDKPVVTPEVISVHYDNLVVECYPKKHSTTYYQLARNGKLVLGIPADRVNELNDVVKELEKLS